MLPCVAMAPPPLVDFILSRNLADGVVVAGCAESACFHRLGIAWTKQRFAGTRDPRLRTRVPRERIVTIWTSALETKRLEREIACFKRDVAKLPAMQPRPSSTRMPAPQTLIDRAVPARQEVGS